MPHIFERFYKGDKARLADGSGAGLGLAIAQRIVEEHPWTLEVESQVGIGSAFYIKVPLHQGIIECQISDTVVVNAP